jgi:hypothetical protein
MHPAVLTHVFGKGERHGRCDPPQARETEREPRRVLAEQRATLMRGAATDRDESEHHRDPADARPARIARRDPTARPGTSAIVWLTIIRRRRSDPGLRQGTA